MDERMPESGPITAAQSAALCSGCVRCCTYVAVEVDAPDAPWLYDQYIWLLYHKNVWMYVESGNHWYVQFETVCEKLTDGGRCAVHGRHPVLCKEYDPRSCERRGELSEVRARFYDGDDLVAWMKEHRPVHYRRYRAWFEKQHASAPASPSANGASNPAVRGEKAKTQSQPALVRFEMPPPPVNPFLTRTVATRIAKKKPQPRSAAASNPRRGQRPKG